MLMVASLAGCARETAPADAQAPAATATAPAPAASDPNRAAGPLVEFSSLGGNGSGYLAVPPAEGRKPAVIVIQEWWGVNDWIREQTDRLAGQGYVALAVDLYRGRLAATPEKAHELSRALPEDRAMADLRAGFGYLASRADVDPARIGVVGWCLGGGYALALAANEPRLAAAAINYGRLISDPAGLDPIRAPILGNFGTADRGIPAEDVRAFERALKAKGKAADVRLFEGAGHAFMNPGNQQGYDPAAAKEAAERIDRFFAENLRAKIPSS